jgi:hypothetical protein
MIVHPKNIFKFFSKKKHYSAGFQSTSTLIEQVSAMMVILAYQYHNARLFILFVPYNWTDSLNELPELLILLEFSGFQMMVRMKCRMNFGK